MSKRGKDEAVHGGDEPPKKSSKRGNDSDDDSSDQIVICELSKNRKVSVRSLPRAVVVDMREYYYKDGKELPGKKGISLSMDQWKILRDHTDEIDKELAAS